MNLWHTHTEQMHLKYANARCSVNVNDQFDDYANEKKKTQNII